MPPNPPAGWQVPLWLQIAVMVAFIATPFLTVWLNWHLKDRRAQGAQEGQALVDDQAGFIDKILRAAEMAPKLLEANEKLIEDNAGLKAQVGVLTERIKDLEGKVAGIEHDRDAWRDMAQRVPNLEGQVETYEKLLREKMQALEAANSEREKLTRELMEARAFRGEMYPE